jgi:membrane protein DedA with SNARE-associated domain
VQPFLDWLASLPVVALYGSLAIVAALENIFPPIPADTVVAFGSFLAARGQGTLLGAFLSTWSGNIAGAMFMYWIGHRYGYAWIQRKWGGKEAAAPERIRTLYARHGLLALFVSRFLPGIRAVVPPVAGALRIGALQVGLAMAVASAIWYGAIAVIAFRIGTDWDRVMEAVGAFGTTASIVAGVIAALALLAFWLHRRRQ